MMDKKTILVVFVILSQATWAQKPEEISPKTQRLANDFMREGNTQYEQGKYADAEVAYKKSLATVENNLQTKFNLANAMMQQKRYKEAFNQYQEIAGKTKDFLMKSTAFHNMGNAQMGLKEYQKAVDAYKNSLRLNPDDEETRYNLALAQKFLKENPPQQNQNQQNQQNQDNKQNKDQQDQKDQKNDPDKDNKDPKKDDQQNKDSQDQKENQDKQDPKNNPNQKDDQNQNGQPKPQPGKMSEQQMKQLLEAINNEEKKTQDKVKAQKVRVQTKPNEKDW